MKKINLGITGQSGFIGSWIHRKASCNADFQCIEFSKDYFFAQETLKKFTDRCDVIIHLAGLSRHENGEFLYETNVELTKKLINACSGKQKIMLGSTTHEAKDAPYHASKRKSAEMLEKYGNSTTLLMANTFGPGSKPFYNSVVSTFCKMAADGNAPERIDEVPLQLIFVDDLCKTILDIAEKKTVEKSVVIPHTAEYPLNRLWNKLLEWKTVTEKIPLFTSLFEAQLYFTFRSYSK